MNVNFDFNREDRLEAWDYLIKKLEKYYNETAALPVAPNLDQKN